MGGPSVLRIEYWDEANPLETKWVSVGIDTGLRSLEGIDRRCVSLQFDDGPLHRYAEKLYVWECPRFVYVGAGMRPEWGDCYIESMSKETGERTRVSMSIDVWNIFKGPIVGPSIFVGVSMPNPYARHLGFLPRTTQ